MNKLKHIFRVSQYVGKAENMLTVCSAEEKSLPAKKEVFLNDTKLYLMVKLQFWRSGVSGISLHYH